MLPFLVVSLLACGSDELTRLETRQRSLEREVAVLRQTVGDLRGQLQQRGITPSGPHGPRVDAAGALAPLERLVDELPMTLRRTGVIKAPLVGEPERRDDTDCGWRIDLAKYEPVSDFTLGGAGMGRASPLTLAIDGKPATPHSQPKDYEKGCEGAFRHQGRFLFFSPHAASSFGKIELAWSPDLPLIDEEGRPRVWVYPGTTLDVALDGTWDEGTWGEPHVVFDVRVIPVGPVGPAQQPTLRLPDGRELRSFESPWRGSEVFSVGPDPVHLTLSSPEGGPFLLVEGLAIGNDSYAAVVTSKRHPAEGAP